MHFCPRLFIFSFRLSAIWVFIHPISACSASDFPISEIAPGIYVHQGVNVNLQHPTRDDIANIGFIVGNRCVAIVDTGGSVAIGHKLKTEIRKITSLPLCYVINTHVHFDHVLGNHAFKADHSKFVGHHRLGQAIEANREFFSTSFANELHWNGSKALIVAPDTLVTDTMILDLGNRELLLSAYRSAHTFYDLTVLDRKTNTLWLGDLLFSERVPSLDGSLLGWIEVTNQLRKLKFARVIPGHGPVSMKWPEAADNQLRYFHVLAKDIRKIIASGGFLEDALKIAGYSERNIWQLFEEYHRRNITRAFAELEWE